MYLSKSYTTDDKELFRDQSSIAGKQSQRNSEISDFETYNQQEGKFLCLNHTLYR